MFCTTVLPRAICAPVPISISLEMVAPGPIQTSSPIVTRPLTEAPWPTNTLWPSRHWCDTKALLPIWHRSPITVEARKRPRAMVELLYTWQSSPILTPPTCRSSMYGPDRPEVWNPVAPITAPASMVVRTPITAGPWITTLGPITQSSPTRTDSGSIEAVGCTLADGEIVEAHVVGVQRGVRGDPVVQPEERLLWVARGRSSPRPGGTSSASSGVVRMQLTASLAMARRTKPGEQANTNIRLPSVVDEAEVRERLRLAPLPRRSRGSARRSLATAASVSVWWRRAWLVGCVVDDDCQPAGHRRCQLVEPEHRLLHERQPQGVAFRARLELRRRRGSS